MPAGFQPVKSPRLDETFQGTAVQSAAVHPLAEIIESTEGTLSAFPDHRVNQITPHALDRVEAKADAVPVHSKPSAGNIDIRRQHLYAQALTFGGVFNDFGGVIQHTGEQGRHEFPGIMAFEIRCLERHIGVTGRVGFVEGVGSEADHIVINLIGHLGGDSVFDTSRAFLARVGAAIYKMLPFRLHHLVLLFAHGAAHIVGLAIAEARELTADLHDLFLINHNTVGHINNMCHLRRLILNLGRVLPVAEILGNGIHRPGAVEGDQRDDIFQIFRLHTDQQLRHAAGFQLEQPYRLTVIHHGIGGRIIIVDLRNAECRFAQAHRSLGVMDDRQGAQAQEVHFEQAKALNLHHIELGHRKAVIGGKGHIFSGRFPGDHDACGMGGSMAGHSLHLEGGVNQLMNLWVAVIHRLEVGRNLQRVFEGHLEIRRNQFGNPVHFLIGHSHHAAHIAHCGAGRHGPKGHNLGHMVPAVFLVHIVNHFLTALIAEVHVKVRH